MRVLFLTRYPMAGASSRYRVFQYIPDLRRLGVECEVQSFMDERLYALTLSKGAQAEKIARTLHRSLVRLGRLLRHERYDVVYMQRELFPFAGPVMEKWLRARGAKLVFDYDDALFIKKPSKHNKLATLLRSAGKTVEIFKLVDLVIAGNDHLRDTAREHGAPAATLLVAEDAERVPPKPPGEGPLVVGWLGSPSTEKYLEFIREPLTRFFAAQQGRAVMKIMGGGDFTADFPVEHLGWSLEGEIAALTDFDIGLMPLPQDEWSLGKSGGKARTYMAAGVVPVCQAIGYNLELIEHGRTGFLVTGADEWHDTLTRLAADPELRAAVSQAARAHVAEHFSIPGQAANMKALLEDVVAGRTAQYRGAREDAAA